MAVKIILDAGHGGFDNGASYMGRAEKDDALRLALAVGEKLEQDGYDVCFTRTTDVYQSPYEKAELANQSQGQYLISFHRNSGVEDNLYRGVQSLIYEENETVSRIADNINAQMEKIGFRNLGTEEIPALTILRETSMPAVLLEAGFTNEVDKIVMVYAPSEVRIARAIRRDSATRKEVERRIQSQMDDEKKRGAADFVIVNDGETPLIPQVLSLISSLSQNH